jgi:hypothetical protein
MGLAKMTLRNIAIGLVASGSVSLALIAANPLGLVRAYPMPPEEFVKGPFGVTEPIKSVESLYRRPSEPEATYFERLTKTVAAGIVHYWSAADTWAPADEPYTRVSPWDNYLLWLHPLLPAYEHFRAYEFITPEHAIRRGYGFCSQVSRIVYSVLADQGIKSEVLSNPQHVIVEANGQILDADYGIYIPHSTAWMQAHPDMVKSYYRDFDGMAPLLTDIYKSGWEEGGPESLFAYMRRYEQRMDMLKWVPPFTMLAAGLALLWLLPKFAPRTHARAPR